MFPMFSEGNVIIVELIIVTTTTVTAMSVQDVSVYRNE